MHALCLWLPCSPVGRGVGPCRFCHRFVCWGGGVYDPILWPLWCWSGETSTEQHWTSILVSHAQHIDLFTFAVCLEEEGDEPCPALNGITCARRLIPLPLHLCRVLGG